MKIVRPAAFEVFVEELVDVLGREVEFGGEDRGGGARGGEWDQAPSVGVEDVGEGAHGRSFPGSGRADPGDGLARAGREGLDKSPLSGVKLLACSLLEVVEHSGCPIGGYGVDDTGGGGRLDEVGFGAKDLFGGVGPRREG
jgi:hypothetical protein